MLEFIPFTTEFSSLRSAYFFCSSKTDAFTASRKKKRLLFMLPPSTRSDISCAYSLARLSKYCLYLALLIVKSCRLWRQHLCCNGMILPIPHLNCELRILDINHAEQELALSKDVLKAIFGTRILELRDAPVGRWTEISLCCRHLIGNLFIALGNAWKNCFDFKVHNNLCPFAQSPISKHDKLFSRYILKILHA